MARINSSHLNYWGLHLATLPISTYITEGIAKICDFQIFRHGTSFPAYLDILKRGADPSYGGKTTQEAAFNEDTRRQAEACKDRFYLFKDSDAYLEDKSA